MRPDSFPPARYAALRLTAVLAELGPIDEELPNLDVDCPLSMNQMSSFSAALRGSKRLAVAVNRVLEAIPVLPLDQPENESEFRRVCQLAVENWQA